MSIHYIQLVFTLNPVQPTSEILIAELGQIGFESFVELDNGLEAYIPKTDWDEVFLKQVDILENTKYNITYTINSIPPKNWNEVWESDFNPIIVGDNCVVRANFHKPVDVKYDLVITPKMSFGTGHHQTTYMMLQYLLDSDLENKTVLDMGCGTGILAVLAEKRGARHIDAVDVEPWCCENATENAQLNKCSKIQVYQRDSSVLKGKNYDIIIANINKNTLLQDIPIYATCLNVGGALLLSGFYKNDLSDISKTCKLVNLDFESNLEKQNWVALKYIKY